MIPRPDPVPQHRAGHSVPLFTLHHHPFQSWTPTGGELSKNLTVC